MNKSYIPPKGYDQTRENRTRQMSDKRERATMLMSRMKSISLDDLDAEEYYSQNEQQQIEPGRSHAWGIVSKHFLRGPQQQGGGLPSHAINRTGLPLSHQPDIVILEEEAQHQNEAGTHLAFQSTHTPSTPPQYLQHQGQCFIQTSSAANVDRSCMSPIRILANIS